MGRQILSHSVSFSPSLPLAAWFPNLLSLVHVCSIILSEDKLFYKDFSFFSLLTLASTWPWVARLPVLTMALHDLASSMPTPSNAASMSLRMWLTHFEPRVCSWSNQLVRELISRANCSWHNALPVCRPRARSGDLNREEIIGISTWVKFLNFYFVITYLFLLFLVFLHSELRVLLTLNKLLVVLPIIIQN